MLRIFFIFIVSLGATLLWDTELLLPLKLLVVLIHEIWHGMVAIIGGGVLEEIHIDLSESGETVVAGLHSETLFFLTVSAGYIGSALTGGFLVRQGLQGNNERITLLFLSIFLAYMAYLFTSWTSTAFYVGFSWAAAFALCTLGGRVLSRYFILFIGSLFVWYGLYDLLDFTWEADKTDAGILALHMVQNDWWLVAGLDLNTLTMYISLLWSLMVMGILVFFLAPALQVTPTVATVGESNIPMEEVPGEVQEWLFSKGLQWDGEGMQTCDAGGQEDGEVLATAGFIESMDSVGLNRES